MEPDLSTYSVYEAGSGKRLLSRRPRAEAVTLLGQAGGEGKRLVLVRDADGKGLEQLGAPPASGMSVSEHERARAST